jgi:trk system potassium uptake protein TrkH
MNVRVISKNVGLALMFNALAMMFCAIAALFYGHDTSFSPLLLSAVISALTGCFPLIFVKEKSPITLGEGLLIIVLSWFLCCIFGMMPYVLWGGDFNLVNAWFESASGYTTTGGTILTNVEALPKGLLLWRSTTHFLGGIGIVVFMLLILPSIDSYRSRISGIEISDLTRDDYQKRTDRIVWIRVYVYIGLILTEYILLMIFGMPSFDAINISFSTISTGGFSVTNTSLAAYHSVAIETIVAIFMVLASLHFGLIYYSVVNRSTRLFKSPATKMFVGTIAVVGLLVGLDLLASGQETNFWHAMRVSYFEAVSTASTTGFANVDSSVWPIFSIILFQWLTIQGGCTSSTAGGIKADRTVIIFAALRAQMKRYTQPNAVIPVRVGSRTISNDVVSTVGVFVFLYFMILFVCAVIYSLLGMPAVDSLTTSISCLGNLGAAFGREGSMGNYSTVPGFAKFIMGIEMLLGRLEIFPVFAVFSLSRKN